MFLLENAICRLGTALAEQRPACGASGQGRLMKNLVLKKNEERRIRAGHLWVFSNEIDTKRTPLKEFAPGEPAVLLDAAGRALGTVYVNPNSLIAARIVSRRAAEPLSAGLIERRLRAALAWREQMYDLPYYRLVHAEGDALPGLILDRYNGVFVAQVGTAGMEAQKPALLEVIGELFKPAVLLFRNDLPGRELEGLPLAPDRAVEVAVGPEPGGLSAELEILEQGLAFAAPLSRGQKTGWFYDQRDNRARTAALAASYGKGISVLDAFSYVGGFGCAAAAAAGAKEVTFLDASEEALRLAEHNARRNLPHTEARTVGGDAISALAGLREAGRSFDLVCLDPPAFIKRKKDETAGLGAYQRCNELALDLVADGGLLVTSSCSQHLEVEVFRQILARAAARRRKTVRIVDFGEQGADHPVPVAMPELGYLKTFFLRIGAT